MPTKISVKDQSIAPTKTNYTTGSVTSNDGTTIGFRQLGHGPAVVVLHGSMSSAHNHMQLAETLADSFTVYVPDRRGRGLSGTCCKDYSILKEVEDLDALLSKTGADNVFGVSSGGIISLQAALILPGIHKTAVYEPPLSLTRSASRAILTRFNQELDKGNVAAALVTGMRAAQMGPQIFKFIPRRLLEVLVNMAMKGEDKKEKGDYVSMRALAPTLRYDFQLVAEMSETLESFTAIRTEVLLLGGSKSPDYLKTSVDGLEQVLQHATRVEFSGLDHAASWNTDRGGHPESVAQELRRFFA